MNLYRKYRPASFDEVVGQDINIKIIKNFFDSDSLPQSLILTGNHGIGKTSIARLIAQSLNCKNNENNKFKPCNNCDNCFEIKQSRSIDVIELDGASNNGVDEIRQIKKMSNYQPTKSKNKVYIIDEFHMLSTSAFNAFLKILEEPPKNIYFILATTELHQIPKTILSRCVTIKLNLIDDKIISQSIIRILTKEGYEVNNKAVDIIAKYSKGSLRDAISTLEKVLIYKNNFNENDVNSILGLVSKKDIQRIISELEFGSVSQFERTIENMKSKSFDFQLFIENFTLALLDFIISDSTRNLAKINSIQFVKDMEQVKKLDVSHNISIKIFEVKCKEIIRISKMDRESLISVEKIGLSKNNLTNTISKRIENNNHDKVAKKVSNIFKQEHKEENIQEEELNHIIEQTNIIDSLEVEKKKDIINKDVFQSDKISNSNHFSSDLEKVESPLKDTVEKNNIIEKSTTEATAELIATTGEFNTSELEILQPEDLDTLNAEEIKINTTKKLNCNFKYSIEEVATIVLNRDIFKTNLVKNDWNRVQTVAYPNNYFKKYSTLSTQTKPLLVSDKNIILIKVKDQLYLEEFLSNICNQSLFDLLQKTFGDKFYIYPVNNEIIKKVNEMIKDINKAAKLKKDLIKIIAIENDYNDNNTLTEDQKNQNYIDDIFGGK